MKHLHFALLLLVATLSARAQNKDITSQISRDTTVYYNVQTIDGNTFTGQIMEVTSESIYLKTSSFGLLELKLSAIEKMKAFDNEAGAIEEVQNINYVQGSRYFYGPSGYGLRKGEAYYQNVYILFNQLTIGFTDHFSTGFNLVPLFLFNGTPSPAWLTPKVSIPLKKDKVNVGVGALIGGVIGASGGRYGVLYGTTTLGSRDHNITMGIGYGYTGSSLADRPTFSLSGLTKVGKRTYLVSENYLFSGAQLFSFGGRSSGKRISIDYYLLMPSGTGGFFAFPMLGLVIPIETNLVKGG